jgi:dipeptide transport system substrate-binding protein
MDVVFLGVAGRPATNPTPPTLWGHADATEPFLHEPEEARRLLAEAGHAGGFSATLWAMPVTRAYNPNARRMAELIQADLARVGIEARIVSYDNAEYIKRSRAGEHDMILLGWIADYPDPDQFLGQIWTCAALKERSSNWARWCNEAFDAKVLAAKRAGDQEERARLYREAQAIFHAEVPAVPIAHSVLFMALRREVTGYVISSMGRQFFHKVDLRD